MKYKFAFAPSVNKSPSYGGIFDLARMTADLQELEAQMVQPNFWNDARAAAAVSRKKATTERDPGQAVPHFLQLLRRCVCLRLCYNLHTFVPVRLFPHEGTRPRHNRYHARPRNGRRVVPCWMKYEFAFAPLVNKSPSYGGIFDLARMTADLQELEAQMVQPNFWNDARTIWASSSCRPPHFSQSKC